MGIQGLLPLLKSIMSPIHIKELKGEAVAVDTYSWLHKGALSCSKEICKGEKTSRHIDYCMHRVNLLRHHGVKPILVFDGGLLPMKSVQEVKRSRARKENLERAIEHESSGNHSAAYECYQKAVDISPSVAAELIEVLKQEKVDYVVAPYEADAQMTFLFLKKHVAAVITEDSDLIPFGCSRIVFKMDKFGQGVEFQYSMLSKNRDLNFTGFTNQMLLEMCILSGCDYLQSLPGMGLKKAHTLVQKFKSYEKVIKHLRYSAVSVPSPYEENFKKAIWTFQHQRVYDPVTEDIVHLLDFPFDLDHNLDFLGPSMPQSVVKGIAKGDLDPFTKMPFQGLMTIHVGDVLHKTTYQVKEFHPESQKKKLDLPAQKNVLTNYFCVASVEAKQKFKAPRIVLKNSDSMDESSPSIEDGNQLLDLRNHERFNNANGVVDDLNSLEAAISFRQFKPEVVKHSSAFKVACECDPELDGATQKTSVFKRKVTVRSSYFEHSPASEIARECSNSGLEGAMGKKNTVKRKVIVRSSYFQDKLSDKNEDDNTNTKKHVIAREDLSDDVKCGFKPLESYAFRADCLENALCLENGTTKDKSEQTDTMLSTRSKHIPGFSSKYMDVELPPRNFGCNISHLDHYSDIAEKSMERFVSIVSSFRCTTPGSRASGLRPPLKDMHNTCVDRTIVVPDFSKFSYTPKNKKNKLGDP